MINMPSSSATRIAILNNHDLYDYITDSKYILNPAKDSLTKFFAIIYLKTSAFPTTIVENFDFNRILFFWPTGHITIYVRKRGTSYIEVEPPGSPIQYANVGYEDYEILANFFSDAWNARGK